MIGFIIYELTSKQSREGKHKAEGNEWTHKACVWMKGHKMNERTNKITHARTNKPDNQTSEMPAKQTENGPIARTPAHPAIQQMAEYTYPF